MCGISMILDFEGKAQTKHIQKMMDAIKHRGPDVRHYIEKPLKNNRILLGSNRLQIIDKDSLSNQPFISKNGQYALIFNGEIYNHKNLRNELLATGIPFITKSDTEVLLNWLIEKGKGGIAQLEGMFAFVFVNFSSGEIILTRDRLGIKPLFVHQSSNHFIVSSEISGIFASNLVEKKLNEQAIPNYLAYKYAPRPATFFKNVVEVMPGAIWQIDKTTKINFSCIPNRVEEKNQNLKKLLINAVQEQYSKENNTGLMLSGGVDSTLLLAILNKELGYKNIPVFSINSIGKQKFKTKDGFFSLEAAKLYKAEYNEIKIDENSLDSLNNYVQSLGQPIADSGGFLTWLVAEKASKTSKVLFSGAGADELFGGYNRHKAFYKYLKYKNKYWFKMLVKEKKLQSFSNKLKQLKKFTSNINDNPSITFNNFVQSDTFRIENKLWESNLNNENNLRKALEYDQQNYLSADVLAITDHATMQHSVETRVPYLDCKLVNYTRNMLANNLLKNGTKWLLKKQLTDYGGKLFVNRKKQGLGLPMNDWLKKEKYWEFNFKDQLIHHFVSRKKINMLLKTHVKNKEDMTQELWRIFLLNKWLTLNF